MCKIGESRCFETGLFLHSTYQRITLLLPGFLSCCYVVSDITAAFQQRPNTVTKSTGLKWELLRNFLTKVWDFLLCFGF